MNLFEGSEHLQNILTLVKVRWQTLNVHDGEEAGNEGFTYITLKTWSGCATLRKAEKIIDLNGKQKEQTGGV